MRLWIWMCLWAGLVCGIGATAWAEETTAAAPRSFDRFEEDAETVRGFWLELAASFSRDEQGPLVTEQTAVVGRIALGNDWLEGGILLPYRKLELDWGGWSSAETEGAGDLVLYGKVLPVRTERFRAGLGLELLLPTGDEDEGLGAGEVGIAPFATAALDLGPVTLRSHFGYGFFADKEDAHAPEQWFYGGGLYAPLGNWVAVRAELVGTTLNVRGASPDALSFQPGLDLRVPIGSLELAFRTQGSVGLTGETYDWGVGGSVVLTRRP